MPRQFRLSGGIHCFPPQYVNETGSRQYRAGLSYLNDTGDTNGFVLSLDSKTSTTITVSWIDTEEVGTTTYQLQIDDGGGWDDVPGATSTPATASGLTASTAYTLRVQRIDDNGTNYSNELEVTTDAAPATPAMTHFMGVGGVRDTSFKYRARANQGTTIQIEYSTASNLAGSTTSAGASAIADNDYTATETISGLTAGTTYYYSVIINSTRQHSSPFPSVKTMPTEGADSSIKIAFGSCQSDGTEATIWAAIAAKAPTAFFQLGDFGYPDSTALATQRSNYQTQHAGDYLSEIVEAFPVERVWDDHDMGPDNSHGDTTDKASSLQAWKEYTAYHTLANGSNGIWRSFTIGNVEFFLLDCRYQKEGTKARFPAASTNTADTGSSGTSLVLKAADSPSGTVDFYKGYYVSVESVWRRVTAYNQTTRTCTLDASVVGLSSSSTYFLRKASILDQDAIASDQVDWLIDGVNNSSNRWKVIVSSVPWNATVTGGAGGADCWGDWDSEQAERNYLLQQITAENVIVLSADRHWAAIDDGTNSGWPEITASPLDQTDRSPVEGTWSEGSDVTGHKFGLLEIDGSAHTATLTVCNADGTTSGSVTPLVVANTGGSSNRRRRFLCGASA